MKKLANKFVVVVGTMIGNAIAKDIIKQPLKEETIRNKKEA